ncbi:MAG: hypothetical protein PVH61_02420 [Candidatus Aminicenantes bacterium]|jgi:hypothetical protein
MHEEINELIKSKVTNISDDLKVQALVLKAIELAESHQPTAIADQLEGFVRNLMRRDSNHDTGSKQ